MVATTFYPNAPLPGLALHKSKMDQLKKKTCCYLQVGASSSQAYYPTLCADHSSAVRKAVPSEMEKVYKVLLLYNDNLDTMISRLRKKYGCEVVCFIADVGQRAVELEGMTNNARASGASKLVVKDLKEEFGKEIRFLILCASAIYARKHLLGTSMAHPVIAKAMVDVAREVGADAVAHGCTGKGNDQMAFELAFYQLNPKLKVVAPWHLSHEEGMHMMSVNPVDTPNQPENLDIDILKGVPVSINGMELSPANLLTELNTIGGMHGIGCIDTVGNLLVGMKSGGVYETPGVTIMCHAVHKFESLTLDRDTMEKKDMLALKYADLVYAGRLFDPLRGEMDASMDRINETTTGSVQIKLYKGSVTFISCTREDGQIVDVPEDPANEPQEGMYIDNLSVNPVDAPNQPEEDISSFENGENNNKGDDEGDAGSFVSRFCQQSEQGLQERER